MGINRPSLYAAFGNKEALFRKALDRYIEKTGVFIREALAEPTARAAVERLLKDVLCKSAPGRIRGCLLVQGALACGDAADSIRKELARRRGAGESALRERFERAVAEGDLPRNSDPAALAKYIATFQHGLAVQSAGGADREELLAAVDIALRAWPN
jgi:AcrR family transcriptional regulator